MEGRSIDGVMGEVGVTGESGEILFSVLAFVS